MRGPTPGLRGGLEDGKGRVKEVKREIRLKELVAGGLEGRMIKRGVDRERRKVGQIKFKGTRD